MLFSLQNLLGDGEGGTAGFLVELTRAGLPIGRRIPQHREADARQFVRQGTGRLVVVGAALDRQHPRDMFDIKLLLENEGLMQEVRKAFLVYLISHNRPMVELLRPRLKDMKNVLLIKAFQRNS